MLASELGTIDSRSLSPAERVRRLQSWARSFHVEIPNDVVPLLSRCDSATEVLFALQFARAPGWRVLGEALSNGRQELLIQEPIGGYFADFVIRGNRVAPPRVVEIDGPTHYTREGAQRDAERQRVIESHGFRVVRIWAGRVRAEASNLFASLTADHAEHL